MTPERAKELLPIIQAFSEGKMVQTNRLGGWRDTSNPAFQDDCVYRLKPEQKLVPFTYEDSALFRGKFIKNKHSPKKQPKMSQIVTYSDEDIWQGTNNYGISYLKLFDDYTFEDGSPCGKLVE